MHRTDAADNVANLFSAGNPGTGQQGTKIDVAWLNAVQEEICNLIEGCGITLVKGTNTQLLAAAVAAATANRLVRRDAAGRAQFASPSAAADAATKEYVDGKFPAAGWTVLTPVSPHTAGAGTAAPAFWKDSGGVVHLKGIIIAGDNAQFQLISLPAGCWPLAARYFSIAKGASSVYVPQAVVVGATGMVTNLGATQAVSDNLVLDGISFVAEQ